MSDIDTSREAVERAIHWWQQQDRGTEDDGAASAELGRICRALLAERDAALRDLAAAREALRRIADDPLGLGMLRIRDIARAELVAQPAAEGERA